MDEGMDEGTAVDRTTHGSDLLAKDVEDEVAELGGEEQAGAQSHAQALAHQGQEDQHVADDVPTCGRTASRSAVTRSSFKAAAGTATCRHFTVTMF